MKVHRETAMVIGRVQRTRDFNGRVRDDDWRFTRTYARRDGRWRVIVAYHASAAARSSSAGTSHLQNSEKDVLEELAVRKPRC